MSAVLIGALAVEQPGGRGYPLKSGLQEPTNPLIRMPRFLRAVRTVHCGTVRLCSVILAFLKSGRAEGLDQGLVRPRVSVRTRYGTKDRKDRSRNPELGRDQEREGWL
jgi:hypothetical protein